MLFWKKKIKDKAPQPAQETRAEEALADQELLHPKGEPEVPPPLEADDPVIPPEIEEKLDLPEVEELETAPVPEHTPIEDRTEAKELADDSKEGGWFSRLTSGLTKSTTKITQGITDLVTKKKLDQDALDELEEVLISADLGPTTAMKVVEDFSKDRFGKDISEDEIKSALAESITKILTPVATPLEIDKPADGTPFVILTCGVNGAGKTTTIGKLAYQLHYERGMKVMMAAGDTFRAAAVEQLGVWAERVGCVLHKKDVGADAASVAYEAYEQAIADGVDVLMIDTAGRLQNKKNLMEELQKVIRVLQKKNPDIPHATLLVLDATTGQNAFSQVETFKEMVDVTGLIVTKLDGSAKGGVLVGLADQFGLPVHAVGVGETIKDLQPFDATHYASALVGLGAE